MSIDYFVHLKDISNFSQAELIAYAAMHKVELQIEEALVLTEAEGFQPFHLRVGFIEGIDPTETFLSGFELYVNEYIPEPPKPVKLTFCKSF